MATYSAPRQGTKDVDTLGIEPRAFRMRSGCDTTTPCALCTEGNQAKLVVQKMSAMTKPVGQRSPSVGMRWMATTETGGTANKASPRIALIAFWPCCCCPQSPERLPELQPMSGLVVRENCDQLVLRVPLRMEPINPMLPPDRQNDHPPIRAAHATAGIWPMRTTQTDTMSTSSSG